MARDVGHRNGFGTRARAGCWARPGGAALLGCRRSWPLGWCPRIEGGAECVTEEDVAEVLVLVGVGRLVVIVPRVRGGGDAVMHLGSRARPPGVQWAPGTTFMWSVSRCWTAAARPDALGPPGVQWAPGSIFMWAASSPWPAVARLDVHGPPGERWAPGAIFTWAAPSTSSFTEVGAARRGAAARIGGVLAGGSFG